MIYSKILDSEVVIGAPVTTTLFTKIKEDLDDLNVRLIGTEIQEVSSNNIIATRSTPLYQIGDTTTDAFSSTLPAASEMENRTLSFKKISDDAYVWTILAAGSDTIENSTFYDISVQNDGISLISTGLEWYINTTNGTLPDVNSIYVNSADPLQGGGNLSADRTISLSRTLTGTDFASNAGLAYSKLDLNNIIKNTDIYTAAGILGSKLSLTNLILNTDINTSAAIEYAKLTLTNLIVGGDFAAGTIAFDKMGSIPVPEYLADANNAFVFTDQYDGQLNARGKVSYGSFEENDVYLSRLTGTTSNVQTQLDGKWPLVIQGEQAGFSKTYPACLSYTDLNIIDTSGLILLTAVVEVEIVSEETVLATIECNRTYMYLGSTFVDGAGPDTYPTDGTYTLDYMDYLQFTGCLSVRAATLGSSSYRERVKSISILYRCFN